MRTISSLQQITIKMETLTKKYVSGGKFPGTARPRNRKLASIVPSASAAPLALNVVTSSAVPTSGSTRAIATAVPATPRSKRLVAGATLLLPDTSPATGGIVIIVQNPEAWAIVSAASTAMHMRVHVLV